MATDLDICNNALLMLGARVLTDFNDPASDHADLVRNLWPVERDATLRAHPWNCAIARVQLAALAQAPAFDWSYQFNLPGDFLRILSVGLDGETPLYRVEGRRILADDSPLYLKYIFRNEDITTWDSLLVAATVSRMAMVLAYPVTKSASMQEQMGAMHARALQEARTVDGQEDTPEEVGDFPFLNVRSFGGIKLR